ncbi:MAG: hypothetical protein ACRDRB_25960, partial [Pseudonocardiaceae bacterium]
RQPDAPSLQLTRDLPYPAQEGSMIFSVVHILLTAAITSAVALLVALWRLPRSAWPDIVAVTVLSGAAVLLWRLSANMPELNDDGLPGFSANDWAAPILTFVFLSLFADLRAHTDPDRYRQARVLATLAALAVNVITI